MVGAVIVVFRHPGFGQFSDFGEVPEDIHIQNLIPVSPIEALNIRVLSGCAGLDKLQLDTVLFSPICQGNRDEFWAVIHA